MRTYSKFFVTKKGERAARGGHPWVYGEEVTRVEGRYANGDLVDYAAHQECPVCQFLSTVQLDAAQVSAQIHATHVTELFVSVPASPVIGQSGCISLRAPPAVIC